jgi:phage/conjugal plasmid C-4 type zinc finger TraR family protein
MDDNDNISNDHFVYTPNNEEEAEIAQLVSLFENEAKVRKHREQMDLLKQRPSLEECKECGEPIPEARRRAVAGVELCIDCASFHEQHG